MGVLKDPMGVLKRVNGGIEKIRWGYCVGPMGALVRVNGGIVLGQWGRWSGSMGALRRVRSDRGCLWVRQGCGCGSGRRLSYRVASSTLQGCKLYLAGL